MVRGDGGTYTHCSSEQSAMPRELHRKLSKDCKTPRNVRKLICPELCNEIAKNTQLQFVNEHDSHLTKM
jgi:hypothetical protein